jgi:N-acetylmuramic acid 6-phosphate etherase
MGRHTTDPSVEPTVALHPLDALPTELPNPRTTDLDRLDTLDILGRIGDEDVGVAAAVRAARPEIAAAVELALERWRRGGRIVLFGAGTSGRLATLDAAELIPTYGTPAERYLARIAGGREALWRPVEGVEDDRADGAANAGDLGPDDLALGIAASGRTPWVIAALEEARRRGAATVGLACVPAPRLGAVCDVVIVVETGPEVVAGSTRMKAGTAQKLVLNMLSTALMVRLGKVYRNLMVDLRATNQKLRRRALRLVQQCTDADDASAAAALAAADGSVKLAIAMLRLGLPAGPAARRLEAADGHLARALGEAV